jgi:outer membrane lipoprotein-sorting protein
MILSRRCALGWALVAGISVGGCASLPPPREAGDPVSLKERDGLVARLQFREGKIHSLRGVAAVEVTLDEEGQRYRQALALRSDGRFRMETLGALGLPVLTIASDGNRVGAYGASDWDRLLPVGCQVLNRLLGLKLPPTAFVRLLTGLPPRPLVPSPFVSYIPERHAYLLEGEHAGLVQRLYVDPTGTLLGGELWKGRQGLHFAFRAAREVEGISFPMGIILTQAPKPVSVTVIYQAIEINPILDDRLFSLPLSPLAPNGGC